MLQANLHFLFFEGKVHLLDPPIGIQAQQHAVVLRQFAHAAKVATLDYRLKRPLKSTKNRICWCYWNGRQLSGFRVVCYVQRRHKSSFPNTAAAWKVAL